MNYEAFYAEWLPMEKALKDSAGAIVRLQKAIARNAESGNITEVRKGLKLLSDAIAQTQASAAALSERADGLNEQVYFASGDFARQLLDACAERKIDVRGEKGVYEMFPFKVRVLGDEEHAAEVYVNRKKLPSVRPGYVAQAIAQSQAKLYAAAFKETVFMNELADAYETACLKSGARVGSTQALSKIYKYMVPTARARREYDAQAYAFDLARLFELGSEAWITSSGARFTFGTSRDGQSGIRVLSRTGMESYINTLRPLNETGD